jgi:hypothetical protein
MASAGSLVANTGRAGMQLPVPPGCKYVGMPENALEEFKIWLEYPVI